MNNPNVRQAIQLVMIAVSFLLIAPIFAIVSTYWIELAFKLMGIAQ